MKWTSPHTLATAVSRWRRPENLKRLIRQATAAAMTTSHSLARRRGWQTRAAVLGEGSAAGTS